MSCQRETKKHEPLYQCELCKDSGDAGNCYPAEKVREWAGVLYCENCYEADAEPPDGGPKRWADLAPFVPPYLSTIVEWMNAAGKILRLIGMNDDVLTEQLSSPDNVVDLVREHLNEIGARADRDEDEVDRWKSMEYRESDRNGLLRKLVENMVENDPADMAADGVTVLDAWRRDARAALGEPRIGEAP